MAHETLQDHARAMAQLRAIWHCEIFDTTPAACFISIAISAVFNGAQVGLDHLRLRLWSCAAVSLKAVSYTHLRAHETVLDLVCRLLLDE